MPLTPAITLHDVTCTHQRRPAVHHASGTFASGSMTAIVGPNGAGKTTLLRALAGVHPIDDGRIDRGGLAASRIALLGQPSGLDRQFPIACGDVVVLGSYARTGAFGRVRPTLAAEVDAALHRVGLDGFARRLVGTLSAGQFQRLLFARLIVQDAPVLLLDEPFNAVDARTTADLLGVLGEWHAQGRTVVAVLHDLDLVTRAFPHTLLLAREVVAWGPTAVALGGEMRMRARLTAEAWEDTPALCRDGRVIVALLFDPFGFSFMRHALVGCVALSLAAPPLGVFLVLRRMSLMSDVLQHGVLPGIAIGAVFGGLSLWAMGLGGFAAGLAVALLAGALARATGAREDSQLAGVYLIALAAGVAIISATRGIDLAHLLFGSVLAVDDDALLLMAGVASVALGGLAVLWRPLVLESLDPGFMRAIGGRGGVWHLAFLALVVLCVVGGFAAMGTLMSVGLMMLPAIAARHWAAELPGQMRAAVLTALLASVGGLLVSFHLDVPAGPAIVLTAGAIWIASVLAGPHESLALRLLRRAHFAG